MNDRHDIDENDDYEAQLRRYLDEARTNLEGPRNPEDTFPKVEFPDRLLGASDEERGRFLWASAHRAVFDPDPCWRTSDMPVRVLQELHNKGVSQAVQAWVAYVLRDGRIPHCAGKGRAADMRAKSDYRHNLAMFILDHETPPECCTKTGKPSMSKLLESAAKALSKSDSKVRQTYYDGGAFKDYLDTCRRQRAFLKTLNLYK